MKNTIVICVEGGFLQEVHTDLPDDIEIRIMVMDKDSHKVNPGGPEADQYAKCKTLLQKDSMRSIYEL